MTRVRVEKANGDTYETRNVEAVRMNDELDKQSDARIIGSSPLLSSGGTKIPLSKNDDEIFVEVQNTDEFGGILRDINRHDTIIELLCDSFERYARDGKPSNGKENVTDYDDTIVNDAIDASPEISAGTVERVDDDTLSFQFHHASQALKIRKVRNITQGEILYNPDKTVDYVTSLGDDKTNTTLTPSSQVIAGQVNVQENTGENEATHLRVIGANNTSVEVSLDTFDGREKWRRAYFSDTRNEELLTKYGNTLLNVIRDQWKQVEMTLVESRSASVDPQLGDTYHIEFDRHELDDNLRIVKLQHIVDNEGERWRATFSNREMKVPDFQENTKNELRDNSKIHQYDETQDQAGIIVHTESGTTVDGVTVDADNWVEIIGKEIHFSKGE